MPCLMLLKARFLKASANEIKTRGEIEIERSNYFALVGKNPSNVLRFPKEDYFIPQSLKEVIEISLKHNPRIISFGLVKKPHSIRTEGIFVLLIT